MRNVGCDRLGNSLRRLCFRKERDMAKESTRVKSEAGKAMHARNKVTRSLAGEVLRQAQTPKKSGSKRSPKR